MWCSGTVHRVQSARAPSNKPHTLTHHFVTNRRGNVCVQSSENGSKQLVFRVLPLSHAEDSRTFQQEGIRTVAASGEFAGTDAVHSAKIAEERLEESMRSELLQFGAAEMSNLPDKVASKYEGVMTSLNTKFVKLVEEQDHLQHTTSGIAKQLHNALLELEKLLADRLLAEQEAVSAELEFQQSVMQLEVVTAQRDAAMEQAQKLKNALQVWEGKNQRLAGQLKVAKKDVFDLSESQSKLESRFLELYEKREQLQQRVADAEEVAEEGQHRVQKLQKQVSALSADLDQQSKYASQLSTQLSSAQQDLQKAEERQQQLDSLLRSTQLDASTAHQQLAAEQEQAEALKAKLSSEESARDQLQQQLTDLQNQVHDLQSSSAATQTQLSTQLADSQRYTSRLRQQLQQTTYQHDMISDSNHSLLERLDAAEAQIKDLNQELSRSRESAETAGTGVVSGSVPDASAWQDQLQVKSSALQAVDRERKAYAISNQQLRQQVTQLDNRNQHLSSEQADLQRQIEQLKQQQQLESVNSWVSARGKVMEAYSQRQGRPHSTMALVAFANGNRFWVPQELRVKFLKSWMDREQHMLSADGFLGLALKEQGEEVSVLSLWLSVATWEGWALSSDSRRSHLPSGIQQYVPQAGEGFPEDFVPFREYVDAVAARYK